MATIKDVEVFATGTHNGRSFSGDDLDTIVRAFDEGGLAGKLPVKLGHSHDDSQPSQGWITAMRRAGDKIVADVGDVAPSLIEEIKQGRWRHVSIELLHDATIGGKKYTWAPDGLAILGAVRPAVQSLEGLHRLVASALPGITYRERLAFSYGGSSDMVEQEAAIAIIKAHEDVGLVHPRTLHEFSQRPALEQTIAAAKALVAKDLIPERQRMTDGRATSRMQLYEYQRAESYGAGDPGAEFSACKEAIAKAEGLDLADPVQHVKAQRLAFARHPELGRAWLDQPGKV